jgi:hypothetical protein
VQAPQSAALQSPQALAIPAAPHPQQAQQIATEQQALAAEPRGMVGRAVQYANTMVQKLAAHFETKLPAHVIAEVKEIGHTMANTGMKEASIPTGPEQIRSADLPARTQQQAAQQTLPRN